MSISVDRPWARTVARIASATGLPVADRAGSRQGVAPPLQADVAHAGSRTVLRYAGDLPAERRQRHQVIACVARSQQRRDIAVVVEVARRCADRLVPATRLLRHHRVSRRWTLRRLNMKCRREIAANSVVMSSVLLVLAAIEAITPSAGEQVGASIDGDQPGAKSRPSASSTL